MAFDNATELIWNIPPELLGKIGLLITIVQAVGWFILFYIAFSIVNTIINNRRNKKIDLVLLGINNINKNLESIKNILYAKKN